MKQNLNCCLIPSVEGEDEKLLDFSMKYGETGNSKDIERMITGSYEILNDAFEFMKKIYDAQQTGKVVARMEI